jgi:hypothetical protein
MADILDDNDKATSTGLILTKENWAEWIDYYEDVLTGKGLWEYTQAAPKKDASTPEEKTALKNDSKAVALLKRAAGTTNRVHLIGLRTSKAVLDKLREVNEVSQSERVQSLLTQFHGFKAHESIDLSASKLTQLQTEIGLASKDERPSDTSKKAILIQSLPEQYQSTVFALKASGLTGLTFETVVQRLRDVEVAMELPKDNGNLARLAKAQNNRAANNWQRGTQKIDKECFYCHRIGHLKRDCRKLQRDDAANSKDTEMSNAAWSALDSMYQPRTITDWILDSGSTRHMTGDQSWFVDYAPFSGVVTIADGKTLRIQGKGMIKVIIDGVLTSIPDVIHVPDIGYNLLSIGQLAERQIFTAFDEKCAILRRDNKVIVKGVRYGKTYAIQTARHTTNEKGNVAVSRQDQSLLWHRRFAHPSDDKLKVISEAVNGVPAVTGLSSVCDTCATTKATRQQGKQPAERATERLERAHIDHWGPYKHSTIGGNRYMLTITDDKTRKSWIILSKDRKAIWSDFVEWRAVAEHESGCKLKAIRADNAPEIVALIKGLDGVVMEPTTAYTPEQNGTSERLNRTLITKARSMLAAADLPKKLWGEAVHTACYLKNRTPIRGMDKTPEELWSGKKPNGAHLRVFGCVAFTHIPSVKRDKLDNTAFKGVFVGYSQSTKQYRVWNPKTNAV